MTLLAILATTATLAAMALQWAVSNPKLDDQPKFYGRDWPEYNS